MVQTRVRSLPWGLLVLFFAARARATVFVPPTIEDLARHSDAVVAGSVEAQSTVRDTHGRLETRIEFNVRRTLRGPITAGPLLLRSPGGVADDIAEMVDGAPQFVVGEQDILFLTRRADGGWACNQMALGKWQMVDLREQLVAVRQLGSARVVSASDSDPDMLTVTDMLRRLAAVDGISPPPPSEVFRSGVPRSFTSSTSAFRLRGPSRFFEFDERLPVAFLIDPSGDITLGLPSSRAAIQAAFEAWNDAPGARIQLVDGGLASDLSGQCPGPSVVRFNDPYGEISAPIDCHGILALGGSCSSTFEKKTIGGIEFERARRGVLTFADGWDGCELWNECNLAEIATHEIGHALGLEHSSENPNELNTQLSDATMYYRAHFDGRCAAIRNDDAAGAAAIYPEAPVPVITTPSPLTDALFGVPFALQLEVSGGVGPYLWSLDPNRGGVPGIVVSTTGLLAGIPTKGGRSYFLVRATGLNGDSHTKVLEITVVMPATAPVATPTITPSLTTTPTSTATSSPSLTASRTRTATRTPSPPFTPTSSRTATASPSPTVSHTRTPSRTASATPSEAATPSPSPTASASSTLTATPSSVPTASPSSIPTASPSTIPTPNPSASPTFSATASTSATPSATYTPWLTASATVEATRTATESFAVTASPTPSATESPVPTFTASEVVDPPTPTTAPSWCTGDCNLDGAVTVDEVLALVSVALGAQPVSQCPTGDVNGDGLITVDEVLLALERALRGCN